MENSLLQLDQQVLETLKNKSPLESINVLRLNEKAAIPTRVNPTDAGLDLYASETVFIPNGQTQLVKTGISIQIPVGYVGKIEDRSSMSVKGLRTGGGVVDAGYNGEIGVVIHNLNNDSSSGFPLRGYLVEEGQKIAQLLVYKVETPKIFELQSSWESERGNKGFGSSGV